MGYYISNMIGIRLGGVFSDKTDMDDVKKRIGKIVLDMRNESEKDENVYRPDLGDKKGDVSHCLSKELVAHKGSYAVIAGVFNYWTFDYVEQFAKRLSDEFQTEVMLMSWNEERDEVQCNVYLAGRPLFEVSENPIGRILRRTS